MDIRAELAKKIEEWLREILGDFAKHSQKAIAECLSQKFDSVETFIEEDEVQTFSNTGDLYVVAGIKVKLGRVGIDNNQ